MKFVFKHGLIGLTVLGLVFLAVTGAEALYADLGHFGRKPIQAAWFWTRSAGAYSSTTSARARSFSPDPTTLENPFYLLYPDWALIPMVILATLATIIASQAVITGAFSLTRQAIQLGLLPRFGITHTSETMQGQIYLPRVNWMLLIAVLFVVFAFRARPISRPLMASRLRRRWSSTSLIAFFVIWRMWGWSVWQVALLIVPLLFVEQAFFLANMLKVFEGAWVPLAHRRLCRPRHGRPGCAARAFSPSRRARNEADLDWLLRKLEAKPPHRVPGTAVFFTADPDAAPTALMHNLKHNRVLHERNIILSIRTEDVPRVPRYERVTVDRVTDTFIRVVARYGFMETPSVPKILEAVPAQGSQHRHWRDVVLPVAPQSAGDAEVGDARLAGPAVRGARAQCAGRHDLLPDPHRSRRRGRHAGRRLTRGRFFARLRHDLPWRRAVPISVA